VTTVLEFVKVSPGVHDTIVKQAKFVSPQTSDWRKTECNASRSTTLQGVMPIALLLLLHPTKGSKSLDCRDCYREPRGMEVIHFPFLLNFKLSMQSLVVGCFARSCPEGVSASNRSEQNTPGARILKYQENNNTSPESFSVCGNHGHTSTPTTL
jgi:hypothetical protein